MNEVYKKIQVIALERTWVSFLHENHPYTLLRWSISSMKDEMEEWLLQNEITFEIKKFSNVDEAMYFIMQNMYSTDILLE
ncbi:DUF2552 family protein [Ectobacillus polymachus]|uniref:DUF2552 family protein n=1 Tax=Ectobacillus polymachus TaxID=1508806 RepID=UPI003A88EAEA